MSNPFVFREPATLEGKYEFLQTIHMCINFFLLQGEEKTLNIAFFLLKLNIDSFKIIMKNTYQKETGICLLESELTTSQIIHVIHAVSDFIEDMEIRDIYSKHISLITSEDLISLLKKLEAFENDPAFKDNDTDWLLNNLLLGTFNK